MWASFADRLRFKLQDGLAVLVRGKLEVYPSAAPCSSSSPRCSPRASASCSSPSSSSRPSWPARGSSPPSASARYRRCRQRLGLVTSSSGAAVRDVLKVLSRWPHLQVLLYPVRVQGKGAEGEIARAVRYLGRSGLVDVVLVVRGGGSLEDLWSFNEEMVARAIAASPGAR